MAMSDKFSKNAGVMFTLSCGLLVAMISTSEAADDLTTRQSPHSFVETLERVERAAREKGFVVFGRLDHTAAAASVGSTMPGSTVLVIGNPRVGTERFIRFPTYAIDLPLKMLVWEDQKGAVSVSYNTAGHNLMISKRHGLPIDDAVSTQSQRTEQNLAAIAEMATR
jgi:uncharacterized protein (DUF302 family)